MLVNITLHFLILTKILKSEKPAMDMAHGGEGLRATSALSELYYENDSVPKLMLNKQLFCNYFL